MGKRLTETVIETFTGPVTLAHEGPLLSGDNGDETEGLNSPYPREMTGPQPSVNPLATATLANIDAALKALELRRKADMDAFAKDRRKLMKTRKLLVDLNGQGLLPMVDPAAMA